MPDRIARVLAAARAQIGDRYVPDYVALRYPMGDVPRGTGVCTDVVIRSLRSVGIDLQRLVHEDMRRHFASYPKRWGLRRPDPNIDHRRVPNLQVYFRRMGWAVSGPAFLPADLVTWRLPGGRDHLGLVSDRRNARGVPLVLHNLGPTAREDDCLFAFRVTGHFRAPAGQEAVRPSVRARSASSAGSAASAAATPAS